MKYFRKQYHYEYKRYNHTRKPHIAPEKLLAEKFVQKYCK